MRRLICLLALVALMTPAFTLASTEEAVLATLAETADQLALRDDQKAEARRVIGDEFARTSDVIDAISDDLSFESVVDLLAEAKNIRESFVPSIQGILDEDQKERLDRLPHDDSFYIGMAARMITDSRIKKLSEKVGLSETQIPEARRALDSGFRDALEVVYGLAHDGGEDAGAMDILVDLRGIQRGVKRDLGRVLDEGQMAKLD